MMGLIYVCWVDPFDGFDLVLVSYGFDGFDLVLVSYEFDGLIDFDFFFFHMGLIGLVSYWWLLSWFWFHYFDLLF